MNVLKLWVPGEECDGGLLVTDAKTGQEVIVRAGEVGHLDVPRSGGRVSRYAAVRATVVSQADNVAVVKTADGKRLSVKVVGQWQFGTGKRSAASEEAQATAELSA